MPSITSQEVSFQVFIRCGLFVWNVPVPVGLVKWIVVSASGDGRTGFSSSSSSSYKQQQILSGLNKCWQPLVSRVWTSCLSKRATCTWQIPLGNWFKFWAEQIGSDSSEFGLLEPWRARLSIPFLPLLLLSRCLLVCPRQSPLWHHPRPPLQPHLPRHPPDLHLHPERAPQVYYLQRICSLKMHSSPGRKSGACFKARWKAVLRHCWKLSRFVVVCFVFSIEWHEWMDALPTKTPTPDLWSQQTGFMDSTVSKHQDQSTTEICRSTIFFLSLFCSQSPLDADRLELLFLEQHNRHAELHCNAP